MPAETTGQIKLVSMLTRVDARVEAVQEDVRDLKLDMKQNTADTAELRTDVSSIQKEMEEKRALQREQRARNFKIIIMCATPAVAFLVGGILLHLASRFHW